MPYEAHARIETGVHVDDHTIARIVGARPGPLLVAVGGIHGNEPAGVTAASRVASALAGRESVISGTIVFLVGNVRAFDRGTRFVDADLNRRWIPALVDQARAGRTASTIWAEDMELRELLDTLAPLVASADGDAYVVDLHTTSAGGAPFATLGDTLRNRAFARQFPVSIILGIEEQLDGTLLEYLNNLGCVTLGFEAG